MQYKVNGIKVVYHVKIAIQITMRRTIAATMSWSDFKSSLYMNLPYHVSTLYCKKIPISVGRIDTFLHLGKYVLYRKRKEDEKFPRSNGEKERTAPLFSSVQVSTGLPYQGKVENLFCKLARVSTSRSFSRSLILIFEQTSFRGKSVESTAKRDFERVSNWLLALCTFACLCMRVKCLHTPCAAWTLVTSSRVISNSWKWGRRSRRKAGTAFSSLGVLSSSVYIGISDGTNVSKRHARALALLSRKNRFHHSR